MLSKIELPAYAVFGGGSAETLAEAVIIKWHHYLTTVRKLAKKLFNFGLAVAG